MTQKKIIVSEMVKAGFKGREIHSIMSSFEELQSAISNERIMTLAAAIKLTVGCSVDLGEAVRGEPIDNHRYNMNEVDLREFVDYIESRVFVKRQSILQELLFMPRKIYRLKWDEALRNFRYI